MDDSVFIVFILACAALSVIGFATSYGFKAYEKNRQKAIDEIYGESDDDDDVDVVTENNMTVLSKSSTLNADYKVTVNQVVFQAQDKTRICLALRDENDFQTLMEGDKGTLVYQGKKFISFTLS